MRQAAINTKYNVVGSRFARRFACICGWVDDIKDTVCHLQSPDHLARTTASTVFQTVILLMIKSAARTKRKGDNVQSHLGPVAMVKSSVMQLLWMVSVGTASVCCNVP